MHETGDVRVTRAMLEPVIGALDESEADADALLRELGLPREQDPATRLPAERLGQLLVRGSEAAGDPLLGLRAGRRIRPGHFGLFDLAIRASEDGRDALARQARFIGLIGDVDPPRLVREGGLLWAIFDGRDARPPAVLVDYVLACWASFALSVGGESGRPMRARLARPALAHADAYREQLGCPVEFDADDDGIGFAEATLHRDFTGLDPAVAGAIEDRVGQALRELDDGDALLERVRRVVQGRLREGGASVEEAASELGMSERTLRRRLAARGESFQRLRDAVRCGEAERLLRDPDLPIAEIAYRLGYAEPATFHRAFRRWTGRTPAAHRSAARPED